MGDIASVEVLTKPEVFNAEGERTRKRLLNAQPSLEGKLEALVKGRTYSIQGDLSLQQLLAAKDTIFTNPVVGGSSIGMHPPQDEFDYVIDVRLKRGMTDTEGEISTQALKDLIRKDDVMVGSTSRYFLRGDLSDNDIRLIMEELHNPLIEDAEVLPFERWKNGNFTPRTFAKSCTLDDDVKTYDLAAMSDDALQELSADRGLELSLPFTQEIRKYYQRKDVQEKRSRVGLTHATDVELELLAGKWSEHCNHNLLKARYTYKHGFTETIDNPFEKYIKGSIQQIKEKKPFIKSVLWDNAGLVELIDGWIFAMKYETHNSPCNKDPYGGSITGTDGGQRDIWGSGKGAKVIAALYAWFTGSPSYDGPLRPDIHPRNMLEGIRKGMEHGGNMIGLPTVWGSTFFNRCYMGKPIALFGSVGILPKLLNGKPSWEKEVTPGHKYVIIGGKTGRDGIHGATASSAEASEATPSSHVQVGYPYEQKIATDMLLEARDEGLVQFVQDLGALGHGSAASEMAIFGSGGKLNLSKDEFKAGNLKPWEALVSESQQRMAFSARPEDIPRLEELARTHEVSMRVMGDFTDDNMFTVTAENRVVAYLDNDLIEDGAPQMEIEAEWRQLEFVEPLERKRDQGELLHEMIARENIARKDFVQRQFDSEVQGTRVIGPFVGLNDDVPSSAAVIKPIEDSDEGLAMTLAHNPLFGQIDTYWMAAYSINEAIMRCVEVGGNSDKVVLNDNFNWPKIQDAPHKAGQLIRALQALDEYTRAFEAGCISGKDSMSIGGKVPTKDGKTESITGLPTLIFSATSNVKDINKCVTSDLKEAGDLVYIIGTTKDECGGSEYFQSLGCVGNKVPKVDAEESKHVFGALESAIQQELVESVKGCYRGGIGVALAMSAIAGGLGADIDLSKLPKAGSMTDGHLLYSESASRFIVTVRPDMERDFERCMKGTDYVKIGEVTDRELHINGKDGNTIIEEDVSRLRSSWEATFVHEEYR